MKILIDHNLSPKIAKALNGFFSPEHEIISLREKFDPGTADRDWIEALSKEGRWIIISGDRRITRNRAEYEVFRASSLIGFFLSRALIKSPVIKQLERILALWEPIEQLASNVAGGAVFELPMKSIRIRQLVL